MRTRGPLFGGTLAMWSGGFAFSSSLMKYFREKEDEWNDTIGGAFTGFIATIRSGGLQFAINQAIQMGLIFYFMERLFYRKVKEQKEI
jgi:hypothetical protein